MITYIILSTLALSVFILLYMLVLEREKIFVFNRFYLLVVLGLGLLIPVFELPKPFFAERIGERLTVNVDNFIVQEHHIPNAEESLQLTVQVQKMGQQAETRMDWSLVGIGIYLIGLVFFLGRFIYQLFLLANAINTLPKSRESGYTLVFMDDARESFAFWKYLFVTKASFDDAALEPEILSHELCHIRQYHSFDILLIEILNVIFWKCFPFRNQKTSSYDQQGDQSCA